MADAAWDSVAQVSGSFSDKSANDAPKPVACALTAAGSAPPLPSVLSEALGLPPAPEMPLAKPVEIVKEEATQAKAKRPSNPNLVSKVTRLRRPSGEGLAAPAASAEVETAKLSSRVRRTSAESYRAEGQCSSRMVGTSTATGGAAARGRSSNAASVRSSNVPNNSALPPKPERPKGKKSQGAEDNKTLPAPEGLCELSTCSNEDCLLSLPSHLSRSRELTLKLVAALVTVATMEGLLAEAAALEESTANVHHTSLEREVGAFLAKTDVAFEDLIRAWDINKDDKIQPIEFRKAVRNSMGIKVDNKVIDALFSSLDDDASPRLASQLTSADLS